MPNNKPAKKIRIGYVTATIWDNDGHYNTVVTRSYKDKDDKWQEGDQLNAGDLLNAAKALERAEEWIASQAKE
jgi:hypothetical protein